MSCMKLGGGTLPTPEVDVEELEKTIHDQEEVISDSESVRPVAPVHRSDPGRIIGLVTGGAAAWVVSRRIRVIEVDENE